MCWIAPGPWMSASVNVSPALIRIDGETFQPWPRSRAAFAPVPSVAMPPLPFSPVKFSGLIDRVFARDRRDRSQVHAEPVRPGLLGREIDGGRDGDDHEDSETCPDLDHGEHSCRGRDAPGLGRQ